MADTPLPTVLVIAAPYVDHILQVDESFLKALGGDKGGSHSVGYEGVRNILDAHRGEVTSVAGGSGANTLKGLAQLGHQCAATSMLGRDEAGELFLESLRALNIESRYIYTNIPTSLTVCLVTPDGERTFRAYHGACNEMRGRHLDPTSFEGLKLVHIEGYALYNDDLAKTVMRYAKNAGALVSIDLASFELVEKFREPLLALLRDYIDIVFANDAEAYALLGLKPEAACRHLSTLVDTVVVSMSTKGCWVGHGAELIHCPAYPTKPVDTVGAGDLFAAGFLHGILSGMPAKECAHCGAVLGRAVVMTRGATIPTAQWPALLKELR